jgi:hypothetical protein
VSTGYGYASGQPALCHFGAGSEETVDLEVRLQDGKVLKRSEVKTNQRIVLTEP